MRGKQSGQDMTRKRERKREEEREERKRTMLGLGIRLGCGNWASAAQHARALGRRSSTHSEKYMPKPTGGTRFRDKPDMGTGEKAETHLYPNLGHGCRMGESGRHGIGFKPSSATLLGICQSACKAPAGGMTRLVRLTRKKKKKKRKEKKKYYGGICTQGTLYYHRKASSPKSHHHLCRCRLLALDLLAPLARLSPNSRARTASRSANSPSGPLLWGRLGGPLADRSP
ncbi:hypothetical protein B0T24DRAFT_154993 [Lasiosphaeria ovina]|uniref:Uncharacterized protein n=1 Tax=Lasiosphaeria ovina TaxID=92902 RepID=A0AAE0KMY2_9PEZI|nr:hypothetical protein B0T24DRAFT_154993 [Lasiosphaeria ovina]